MKTTIAACGCGFTQKISNKNYKRNIKRNSKYLCQRCAMISLYNNTDQRLKIAAASKAKWRDPVFRSKAAVTIEKRWAPNRALKQLKREQQAEQKAERQRKAQEAELLRLAKREQGVSYETRDKISATSRRMWANKQYKRYMSNVTRRRYADPIERQASREKSRQLWQDPIYKAKTTEATKQWANNPTIRESNAEKGRKRWRNVEYRMRMLELNKQAHSTEQYRTNSSAASRRNWAKEEYRRKVTDGLKAVCGTEEFRRKSSENSKKMWADPAYRKNWEERWANPEFQEKMAKIRDKQQKVSRLQELLYSILTDLGVKFFRERNDAPDDPECRIGPYSFDCVIPRQGRPTLLVEVQGYRHYWEQQKKKDQAKATYIANNLPNYELKYVWDHEFSCLDRVVETVKHWLGLHKLEVHDFDFKEVEIKKCPTEQYRLLLSKYHYLPNAGRGGEAFGAFLKGELIAVCVFSSLVRQNIQIGKHAPKATKELSRLCIHPRYQKKNFASWLVSRCLKTLPKDVTCVVSYCDTTYNHDGATYKACNFVLDGEVRPDYWYVAPDGWVMHKKALYNHACKMSITEREFAERHGYVKVFGRKKLRFVYRR